MTDEKKIRMATPELPDKQGHTIVGGRPASDQNIGKGIPRGMELLLKRAAVDEVFCSELFSKRSLAADSLKIPLDPAERAMLDTAPEIQLRAIIKGTKVPDSQKRILIGGSTAAMVALLAQLTFAPVAGRAEQAGTGNQSSGQFNSSDELSSSYAEPIGTNGIRPDYPMPPGGCREDLPVNPSELVQPPHDKARARAIKDSKEITVKSDVSGMPLLPAIRLLENECQVKISVEAYGDMDISRTLTQNVSGLSLFKALYKMCREAAPEYRFEIMFEGNVGTIKFFPMVKPNENLLVPTPDTERTRGIRPDIPATQGIRPDFPTTKGIRPDFPPSPPSDDESD